MTITQGTAKDEMNNDYECQQLRQMFPFDLYPFVLLILVSGKSDSGSGVVAAINPIFESGAGRK